MAEQNFGAKITADIDDILKAAGLPDSPLASDPVLKELELLRTKQFAIRAASAFERMARAYVRNVASIGTNDPSKLGELEAGVMALERRAAEMSVVSKTLPKPQLGEA